MSTADLTDAMAPATQFLKASSVLAGSIVLAGGVVIVGWLLDVDVLKSVLPGFATMKFNTASLFVLCGVSLYGLREGYAGRMPRRIAMACAALAFAVALFTLLEYVLGLDLGIDQLVVADLDTDPRSAAPGRMSAASAICFLLFAGALLSLDTNFGRIIPAQCLALSGMLVALVALEGYLFGVSALYEFFVFSSIAIHTAVLFFLLGAGLMCARPRLGLMSTISSERFGGALIRRGLPWAVGIPILIAWLRLQGQRADLYDTEIGLAIFATSSVLMFAGTLWIAARSINGLHAALAGRQQASARLAAIVESSDDAIIGKDTAGMVTSWNRGAERVFGYTESEMLGQPITRLIPPDRLKEEDDILARIVRGEPTTHFETVRERKDGSLIDVSITVSPIRDESGRIVGASKVARDVSDRRLLEKRFHLVVEAAPSAMLMVDGSRTIILANRNAEKLFGYARGDLVGLPIETLVPERFRGLHPGHVERFFAMPEARPMGAGRELFGRRRDGSELPVEIGLNPIEMPGRICTLVSIIDITERKQLEERFRVSVESAPIAMIMVDSEGRIVLVNAMTEALFAYSRADLLGKPVETLLPQRYRAGHPGMRARFFGASSARRMGAGRDLYGQRKDGSEFQVEIGLNPIETSEGVFVLAAVADITERKRDERELQARTEELARSNQELEQFAYIASHDLQEPLRAVSGCVQLLQKRYAGHIDSRADEFIAHAVDGASRMQNLIDDLLTYSRVGRKEDPMQPADSARALDLALKNLATSIGEAGAEVSRGSLPTVKGIPAQIALVFQNLVANAIKFRHGDRPVRIHVAAEPRGGEWEFRVEDNGIGIESQYFERIFVIFQRLHTRREYPGTGIGLALCKRIVERHGGRIWLESTPGQGTTFRFTLPAEPAPARVPGSTEGESR